MIHVALMWKGHTPECTGSLYILVLTPKVIKQEMNLPQRNQSYQPQSFLTLVYFHNTLHTCITDVPTKHNM